MFHFRITHVPHGLKRLYSLEASTTGPDGPFTLFHSLQTTNPTLALQLAQFALTQGELVDNKTLSDLRLFHSTARTPLSRKFSSPLDPF